MNVKEWILEEYVAKGVDLKIKCIRPDLMWTKYEVILNGTVVYENDGFDEDSERLTRMYFNTFIKASEYFVNGKFPKRL